MLATRYNLVRGIAESRRPERVVPETPLTIVAVPVSPVNELVALNTEGEWHDLTKTIQARGKSVALARVRPPTLAAMGRAASGEGTTIVHFMGHSGISKDGQGVLLFEDDLGEAKSVDAAIFVNELDEQTFLVVLNSCYSAVAASTSNGQDAFDAVSSFGNIAQAVVREGVPYALGMQFALPDNAALKITEFLYSAQNNGDADATALAAFIRDLKEGDGNILLTTRVMPPSDWGHCEGIHLMGLSDDAGAELFLASIADDRKRRTTYSDRLALSHYVQGHPLCIRLLAGRFSDDSADTLSTFLKNIQDELTNARQKTPTSSDDSRRQASISECMDYSIRSLTLKQKSVLYTLGIFRAPFLLEFAENVLDDEEHTEKYLQDLMRLGLLEGTQVDIEEGYFNFYELHPMLRWHIKSNVDTLDAETRQRYGLVYEDLARRAWEPQGGYDQSAAMRYIEQEKGEGKQDVVETLEMHLAVLRACKTDGIAETFARLREGEQGT